MQTTLQPPSRSALNRACPSTFSLPAKSGPPVRSGCHMLVKNKLKWFPPVDLHKHILATHCVSLGRSCSSPLPPPPLCPCLAGWGCVCVWATFSKRCLNVCNIISNTKIKSPTLWPQGGSDREWVGVRRGRGKGSYAADAVLALN